TVTILPSTTPAGNILSGRFTGDTLNDVARFNQDGTWTVGVPQSNGPLVAQTWAQWTPSRQWLFTGKGDFNGDGKQDVIAFNIDGSIWVAQANAQGSGFNTTQWTSFSPAINWASIQVGDANGDGKDDVYGFNNDGTWWVGVSTGSSFTN